MKRATRLVHLGRPAYSDGRRPVNPPVVRASTVDYESMASMRAAKRARSEGLQSFTYGVHGTPNTYALENLITDLEAGFGTALYSSGLEAIAAVLLTFVKPGEHMLIVDTVYQPVRHLLDTHLAERGVEYSFYSPREPDLSRLIQPNTRLIYTETPGSVTMELQDLRPLVALARERGNITVACDNTWASGYCFRPLEHGVDLSIVAGTKYLGGHSDVMLGYVAANETAYPPLHAATSALGLSVSPDDCALALRGARTMHVRYPVHERAAIEVAGWLEQQPWVRAVYYPALPSSPDHQLWQAQYDGAAGLFTIELADPEVGTVSEFLDALALFGLGSSWGGFESLALPCEVTANRSVDDWHGHGPMVRLHIGLEDAGDLIADLEQAARQLD